LVSVKPMEYLMTEPYLLTIAEAFDLMRMGRSAFFKLRDDDPDFPKAVRLTPRVVRYKQSDIINYIDKRAETPFTG
jgi:predicted DNA-binding transcriptional regulator AlpA